MKALREVLRKPMAGAAASMQHQGHWQSCAAVDMKVFELALVLCFSTRLLLQIFSQIFYI